MSEIDDIFASKGKQKQDPLPSPEKKKKKKSDVPLKTYAVAPTSKKRPLPETVVDTSDTLPAPSKRRKGVPPSANAKKSKKVDKKKSDVDPEFKDSRGCESRRKTEEGWSVYKEDELGIGDQGGDQTLLCAHSIVIVVFESYKVVHALSY
ncbi:hypothetical protein CPB84DRAFT_1759560 [Gymnopilus junonius]|uniref:Uncharacterized protein n=1 Tax=Gymnopilus junonius TaxID=109634 RepID=A0A9P5TUE0_GYMJU|nr:hypothetical protein CPB84DRAFT_1759560 [Gymnopilus junonius]